MLDEGLITPGRLAWLPLVYAAEQEFPDPLLTDTDAPYRDVMLAGLRVYQLHCYQVMVRQRFGEDMAAQVRRLQCDIFDSEQHGAGAAFASALQLVEAGLNAAVVGGRAGSVRFALPAELSVALALLIGLPESPDFHDGASRSDRPVCQTPGMDERLAEQLATAQRSVLETFSPILARLRTN